MRFWKWVFLIILLLPVLYYGFYLMLRGPLPANILIVAHRGGSALAPENTMTAFKIAAQSGIDAIEMDVQRSKDGALVIMHDETVNRTTNGKGYVRDLTLNQLRELDAGKGERIPTFNDVLFLAKKKNLYVFAEIKSQQPGLEAEMIHAVKEADYESMTSFLSFYPQALQTIASLRPKIPLISLYGLWRFNLGKTQPGRAGIVAPMAEMALLYPWMIRAAHARGERIIVYTGKYENKLTLFLLKIFGVDGMIVNNPVLLKKLKLNK